MARPFVFDYVEDWQEAMLRWTWMARPFVFEHVKDWQEAMLQWTWMARPFVFEHFEDWQEAMLRWALVARPFMFEHAEDWQKAVVQWKCLVIFFAIGLVSCESEWPDLLCLRTSRTGRKPPSRKTNPSFSALCLSSQDRACKKNICSNSQNRSCIEEFW